MNCETCFSFAEHVCVSRRGVSPDDLFGLDPLCFVSQTRSLYVIAACGQFIILYFKHETLYF